MAGWMFFIDAILNAKENAGVLIGGFSGMAIGGPAGAAIGGVVGRIVTDTLMTGGHHSYRILQNIENIRRDGISRDTLRNVIEMIRPIYGDMLTGYQAGKRMASVLEEHIGQTKREDDIMKENSESKKKMSDTTHNFDGETHAQSKSSNADASEGDKAASMSSRSALDVKKGRSHPNIMPLKARKRPGSSQELFPDTILSMLTVTCCNTEKNQTIYTRLDSINSSSMVSISN